MSGWHRQGSARISATSPRALAVCQRCGFTYNRTDLSNQLQWQGMLLQPLNVWVCPPCYDTPQINLKAIVLPPDPLPVMLPFPEPYTSEVPTYRTTQDFNRRVTESGQPRVTEGIPPDG